MIRILLAGLILTFTRAEARQPDTVCYRQLSVKQLFICRLNNIYVLNQTGIFQFNDRCMLTASFTQRITGDITSIDVSNPLKILAFAREEQKIYLLDNQLHVQSVIALSDLGILQAAAICNSRHDGFRVLDLPNQQLVRFDYLLNRTHQTELNLLPGMTADPEWMAENENNIVIKNRHGAFLILDRYGNYLRSWDENNLSGVYLTETTLVYSQNNKIISQRPDNLFTRTESIIPAGFLGAIPLGDRWCYYHARGFLISRVSAYPVRIHEEK
jgi:hypothetical protein